MTQKFIITINTPVGFKGHRLIGASGMKIALQKLFCYDKDGWFNGRTVKVERVNESEDEK